MHRLSRFTPLTLVSLGLCHGALAAEDVSLKEIIKEATVDMPISTAPASFLLGASGENVPRLTSFRAFATQAARAYDDKGNVANAVAVELAPALAVGRLSWEDITSSQTQRILARTLVSLASKAKSGDSPAQSAVGLQSILWAPAMDQVLATMASEKCTRIATSVAPTPPPAPGPNPPLSTEELARIAVCSKIIDAQLTKWNQPMLSIGGGRTFVSSNGSHASTTRHSNSYWITGAYGGDWEKKEDAAAAERLGYLLTAHYRRTTNASVKAPDDTDVFATQRLTGLNARFGNRRLAGIGEYSVLKSSASIDVKDRKRALLGLEYRVVDDLYLTVGVSRDTGADKTKQSVLANLNWGFGKEPVLLAK